MEIIEYKSNGHPDTLTDLIVEACAGALDEYYIQKYGVVLHYNVDKAMFLAGDVKIWFGGGKIIKSPEFILGGQISNLTLDLRKYLSRVIKKTLNKYLPRLKKINISIKCNNVSQALSDICGKDAILANDTSFGVGYFPPSKNEKTVLSIKSELDKIIKKQDIPIGELYKIMLVPDCIYISAPLFAGRVKNKKKYLIYKVEIEARLHKFGKIIFNPDTDADSYYMTLSGSSIECGDDGQVGRGNRFNGLITPCRPMTIEAYHGKNNRNHTGKIYSRWAFEKAKELYKKTGKYTEVVLVSIIGKPITEYRMYVKQ